MSIRHIALVLSHFMAPLLFPVGMTVSAMDVSPAVNEGSRKRNFSHVESTSRDNDDERKPKKQKPDSPEVVDLLNKMADLKMNPSTSDFMATPRTSLLTHRDLKNGAEEVKEELQAEIANQIGEFLGLKAP